jgi:hypothetical protein
MASKTREVNSTLRRKRYAQHMNVGIEQGYAQYMGVGIE